MPFLILLFVTSSAWSLSASLTKDLFEKTWPRANSHCTLSKTKRIEILIRGGSKFTEKMEKGYGEYVFFRHGTKTGIFEFSQSQSSLYRFYSGGSDSSCSKSSGFPISENQFAILLGEENRPHGEKLVIQLFDFSTMKPLEVITTNYPVEKTFARPGGFVFKSVNERYDMDMGTVVIDKQKYTFQDRIFPVWRKYTKAGIEMDPSTTFTKLPWSKYFKDEADFLKCSGWDSGKKDFLKPVVYFAVTHTHKKKCILFTEARKKLDGQEDWHCI